MQIDKLQLFLGKPLILSPNIKLYSPTIKEISDLGEYGYYFHVTFATFDKRVLIDLANQLGEDVDFENIDSYELLTSDVNFVSGVEKSLSFFTKEEVKYDNIHNLFKVKDEAFITKDNFKQISQLIKIINGINNEEKELKFRNEKARQMYLKMQKLKKQHSKDDGISLKDILSILCNADGNGINIFNVQDLTIYQVYEHFERMSMKENHKRLIPVWANGYLGENQKLPEWIAKSKL